MVTLLTILIRFYQRYLSPIIPPACRFYPSCSSYSLQALHRYGFWVGTFMTVRRLARCHPFCSGGYDPVR